MTEYELFYPVTVHDVTTDAAGLTWVTLRTRETKIRFSIPSPSGAISDVQLALRYKDHDDRDRAA